jgi:hypothetical protein
MHTIYVSISIYIDIGILRNVLLPAYGVQHLLSHENNLIIAWPARFQPLTANV